MEKMGRTPGRSEEKLWLLYKWQINKHKYLKS